MHLTIYVHDFHPQIGHSRAMQELLNGLSSDQKASIYSIEIVAFTCTDLDIMFPDFNCPKYFTKIPLPKIKPFLLKMVFYHLLSLIHSLTTGSKRKKIGVGIACLNISIVNVQFIHEQWKTHFFKNSNLPFGKKIYKKLLFSYFYIVEKYIYSFKGDTKYIVIADFLKNFLQNEFQTPKENMTLIPSGVNTDEFKLLDLTSSDLIRKLSTNHPDIKEIRTDLPIALFVGALERKGIDRVLETLAKIPNAQLIVIGKSENPDFRMPKLPFKIVHISFTKEVNLFYQIADIFIFPTRYEPFGLVIIEAYVMGLDLLIPIENVGASEIILQSDGINFFHQNSEIELQRLNKISFEERKTRRAERLFKIKKYSWEASADKFYSILNNL
jgi:glycosyltransferase involved in cell wall biosynthesis